jgi:hypothetical protein
LLSGASVLALNISPSRLASSARRCPDRAERQFDRAFVARRSLALHDAGLLHPRQYLHEVGEMHLEHGGEFALRHRLVVAHDDQDGVFDRRQFQRFKCR